MTEPRQHWGKLERQAQPERVLIDGLTPEEIVMRALSGPAGAAFLDWLRAEYVVKSFANPASTDAQLRWESAQRALVLTLERMHAAGFDLAARRNKA